MKILDHLKFWYLLGSFGALVGCSFGAALLVLQAWMHGGSVTVLTNTWGEERGLSP